MKTISTAFSLFFVILSSHKYLVDCFGNNFSNHAFRGCVNNPHIMNSALRMGFFDDIQKMFKSLSMRADASHILIKGGAEAANKLEDLKLQIQDNPVAFAEAAATYSECPSSRKGGNLGEFGPGQMVKEFDTVVFSDDVGVVHGPIKTQFGYHLILINSRTD